MRERERQTKLGHPRLSGRAIISSICVEIAFAKHILSSEDRLRSKWGPTLYTNAFALFPMIAAGVVSGEHMRLAAVRFAGDFSYAHFSAAFYLPLEGLDLSAGYEASNNMKLVEYHDRHWQAGGIYAANPTLQRIISVEGLPLHLHGLETGAHHGGHLIKLQTSGVTVHIWPLKDLVMRIRNLDHSWLIARES